MNSNEKAMCYLCMFVGWALPWILLVGGAITAAFGPKPIWEMIGVAMIVTALIVFMVTAAIARLSNKQRHSH